MASEALTVKIILPFPPSRSKTRLDSTCTNAEELLLTYCIATAGGFSISVEVRHLSL